MFTNLKRRVQWILPKQTPLCLLPWCRNKTLDYYQHPRNLSLALSIMCLFITKSDFYPWPLNTSEHVASCTLCINKIKDYVILSGVQLFIKIILIKFIHLITYTRVTYFLCSIKFKHNKWKGICNYRNEIKQISLLVSQFKHFLLSNAGCGFDPCSGS